MYRSFEFTTCTHEKYVNMSFADAVLLAQSACKGFILRAMTRDSRNGGNYAIFLYTKYYYMWDYSYSESIVVIVSTQEEGCKICAMSPPLFYGSVTQKTETIGSKILKVFISRLERGDVLSHGDPQLNQVANGWQKRIICKYGINLDFDFDEAKNLAQAICIEYKIRAISEANWGTGQYVAFLCTKYFWRNLHHPQCVVIVVTSLGEKSRIDIMSPPSFHISSFFQKEPISSDLLSDAIVSLEGGLEIMSNEQW